MEVSHFFDMNVQKGTFNFSSSGVTITEPSSIVSGTSIYKSRIIDVTRESENGNFNLWSTVRGDLGSQGTSVYITWEGCYDSGSTYVTPTGTNKIRVSGTSISGPDENGTDSATFTPDIFPFLRIVVAHNSRSTTNEARVDFALITD